MGARALVAAFLRRRRAAQAPEQGPACKHRWRLSHAAQAAYPDDPRWYRCEICGAWMVEE
jgi:hypothetical protein